MKFKWKGEWKFMGKREKCSKMLISLFSGALYTIIVLFLGSTCTRHALQTDFLIMEQVNIFDVCRHWFSKCLILRFVWWRSVILSFLISFTKFWLNITIVMILNWKTFDTKLIFYSYNIIQYNSFPSMGYNILFWSHLYHY